MSLYEFIFGRPDPNPRIVDHPRLGKLEFDGESYWIGKVVAEGFQLKISLDWEGDTFLQEHAEICVWVIDNFAELHKKAQTKLRQTVDEYKIPVDLEFIPNEVLWIWNDEHHQGFSIRFNDNHDEYKLWRVGFQDGEPLNCGYDD